SNFDIIITAQDFNEDIPIGTAEVAPPEDQPHRQRQQLPPETTAPAKANVTDEISVTEQEVEGDEGVEEIDDSFEAALANVTIQDAISHLEALVGIYKKREVPRQLSRLDIVMDELGLSSYFPSLGEAQSKALESTQYISTRLEDVLAKLKGSMESADAARWVEQARQPSPETKSVQSDLQEKRNIEEQLKN